MNILYLVHNDPRQSGGTEKHVWQLAEIAQRDHDVAVFFPQVSKKYVELQIDETYSNSIKLISLTRRVSNCFLSPETEGKKTTAEKDTIRGVL